MKYFKIYNWMLINLNLKGTDLLVYAYLFMWHETGGDIWLKQWQMAKMLNLPAETFSRSVRRLQNIGLIDGLCVKKIDETSMKNCRNVNKKLSKRQEGIDVSSRCRVEKIDETSIKNCRNVNKKLTKRQDGIDVSSSILINKIINKNKKNKREDIAPEESEPNVHTFEPVQEPEQVDASSLEQRRLEIILQGIADQYAERGKVYVPNYATQTTAAKSLIHKIEVVMQHYNLEDTDDQFRETWRRFLTAGYESGDDFQREHWSLDYIDKQYQTIFNKIDNGAKHNSNSKSGKGQLRISADYVQNLMRKAGLNL